MTTITVTRDDIRQAELSRGQQAPGQTCPIARAVQRVWYNPLVDKRSIYPNPGGLPIEMPDEAQEFIYNFDSHQLVKPFTVEVAQ